LVLPHINAGRIARSAGAGLFALSISLTLPAFASANSAPSGGASLGSKSTTSVVKTTVSQASGDSKHMGDRVLREGMTGHDVRVLQDYLTRAGFPTPIVGHFGPTTKQNLIAFQRAHHLARTGVLTLSDSNALRAVVGAQSTNVQTSAPVGPAGKAHLNSDGLATAPANAPAAVRAVIAAGNKIAFKPYIYGGGHGSWNDAGYDCSGSVSYALHGGGLISSTEDSSELESYGGAGPGRWITIWANAGHVYMYVAGLRFDTSAQSSTGGSRWTTQSRSSSGYVERHPRGF
jgi:peptidoglycan hydrolase-like protein with peptidoglycan-binding domain